MAVNPLVAGLKSIAVGQHWRKLRRWSGASYFEAVTRSGFCRVPVRVITGAFNELFLGVFMTECGVCIGSGESDGSWEFQSSSVKTARKEHKCCECNRIITKGQKYHYFCGKFDGDIQKAKTCMDCHNIRVGLVCEGEAWPYFGELWNDIRHNFPQLKSTACLTKIPTASAKAFFLEKWREWKFKTTQQSI